MARARKATEQVEESADAVASKLAAYYQDLLVEVERKVGMTEPTAFNRDRMSTGSACLDLVIGGGIGPGWYTFFGPEGACKTTGALTVMGAAIRQNNVPIIALHDYEGSAGADPDYLESVLRTVGVKESTENIFGVKDRNGKYVVAPKVRYHDEAIGETFFNWLAALERRLPDKRFIGGNWWYIYEDTKENKAKFSEFSDPKMSKTHSAGIYVPAVDGNLQALVIVDSYPAMNPQAMDEDDPNNAIAVQARMFSKHIPRVKGRMRSKRIGLIGVNQLRSAPMVMYGPKELEPGGQALKFNSDCRVKFTPRGSGAPYHPKLEGDTEIESSVEYERAKDTYRYINLKNVKNKLGMPRRESWFRLWVEDGAGNPRGFDPVFDTLQYLTQTGQIGGKRAALRFNIGGREAQKTLSVADFKYLVLGDRQTQVDIYKKLGMKPTNLRSGIFKQLASGKAEDLYVSHKNSVTKVSGDDDE